MTQLLRRHRKFLGSTVLGLWAFAVFIGIANACSWDSVTAASQHPTIAAHAVDAADGGMARGCDEFCNNDVPMLSVVKPLQDQPTGQPPVVATYQHLGVLPIFAPVLRLARTAHPQAGVPFSLGIVRLTL